MSISDAVEEALEAWLSQQGKQPPRRQGEKPISPSNTAVYEYFQAA
jgi:hypothetical protein